jgi:hypothetical protein
MHLLLRSRRSDQHSPSPTSRDGARGAVLALLVASTIAEGNPRAGPQLAFKVRDPGGANVIAIGSGSFITHVLTILSENV